MVSGVHSEEEAVIILLFTAERQVAHARGTCTAAQNNKTQLKGYMVESVAGQSQGEQDAKVNVSQPPAHLLLSGNIAKD